MIKKLESAVLNAIPDPFTWCEIPDGGVYLPVNCPRLDVPSFYMSKYLITYEQFQVFVDAKGGFASSRWRKQFEVTRKAKLYDQAFTYTENLPRENVTWYDAVAFCLWLSDKTGYDILLPTEWEWQWAARGPELRKYPWGDEYIAGYANINEQNNDAGPNYLGKTSPVGAYEHDRSPFGVMDMCGNVREWCLNESKSPTRTELDRDKARVCRGGCWDGSLKEAQPEMRLSTDQVWFSDLLGFRVALHLPSQ
jgi:formylglycine-generating enzyme required for sulfatase activity